jgi:hypothetical protein
MRIITSLKASDGPLAAMSLLKVVQEEEVTALWPSLRLQKQAHARHGDCAIGGGGNWGPDQGLWRQGASHVADPTRSWLGRIFHTLATTHRHLVALAARAYGGSLSCSKVGLM